MCVCVWVCGVHITCVRSCCGSDIVTARNHRDCSWSSGQQDGVDHREVTLLPFCVVPDTYSYFWLKYKTELHNSREDPILFPPQILSCRTELITSNVLMVTDQRGCNYLTIDFWFNSQLRIARHICSVWLDQFCTVIIFTHASANVENVLSSYKVHHI